MSTEPNLAALIGLPLGDSSKLSLAGLWSESRTRNDVSSGGKLDGGFFGVYVGVEVVKSRGCVLLLLSMLSSGFSMKISGTGIVGGAPRREFRRRSMAFLNFLDQ